MNKTHRLAVDLFVLVAVGLIVGCNPVLARQYSKPEFVEQYVQEIAQQSTNQKNVRNARYCEVIPTYRTRLTLRTEIYNTTGLNDCPVDQWAALDAKELREELGAVDVKLNGLRYWVMDEIMEVSPVSGEDVVATFGGIDMQLRAVLETPIGGDLVGEELYTPFTVQRDTGYIFYAGKLIYQLISPEGDVYVMQSYAQIVNPNLTLEELETLGDDLNLPEGWRYEVVRLEEDFMLLSDGGTTVINDDFNNTYQLVTTQSTSHNTLATLNLIQNNNLTKSADKELSDKESIQPWNLLEESFEIANIGGVSRDPTQPILVYISADDPNIPGDNEISEELWSDYTPPLPYIKNTTRNLQFNESQFLASPGAELGTTNYVTTSDGYTWAFMAEVINAMWPYNSADYSGLAAQNAYYAGNFAITPNAGVDTVVLSGNSSDYVLKNNSDDLTYISISGLGYTKKIYHSEYLQFDDGIFSVDDFVQSLDRRVGGD